ncbi:hypothetical protein B0J17DRAFT_668766 [Rhizoctonia solani]|nr:hypothetical protein B0J17DRAFT_668766 [Rhizoctonia solani]
MAEYLTNPDAYSYTPASSPPSSPIPLDTLLNDPEDECQVDSPWKLESDPYSANAKATQSPLLHTRTKRQTYGILTPSSSFNSYGINSPAPTIRSNVSTPIRVQSKYIPSNDPIWEDVLNDVFHNGATIINLDSSNVTMIPREIIDLNNMVSLPLEPPESSQPPPVHSPTTPSRSTIASAAARSRRVFSQSRSNNSLFSSGSPSKPKREIQLYLANNSFKALPSELFQLNNLTLLSLRGRNKLGSLPPAIGNLKSLRSLNIANNELTALPSELSYLNLQTLLLHPNPFLPKPTADPTPTDGPNDGRDTSLRELGPLITPISFTIPTTRLSNTSASKSLLTPTDSHSSVFSFPSRTPPLSRSNSGLNPYDTHTFPPHALELEDHYDLNEWLSQQHTPNIHIRAARHGTEDACNLYSWCPGQKHRADSESEVSSSGVFVLPAEERLEWVSILAGCELSPAVPILWRGCSTGCLGFLNRDISAPLQERDEWEEDEEFMSEFSKASRGNLVPNEEKLEASARVQTHIVWDDMMDLDD